MSSVQQSTQLQISRTQKLVEITDLGSASAFAQSSNGPIVSYHSVQIGYKESNVADVNVEAIGLSSKITVKKNRFGFIPISLDSSLIILNPGLCIATKSSSAVGIVIENVNDPNHPIRQDGTTVPFPSRIQTDPVDIGEDGVGRDTDYVFFYFTVIVIPNTQVTAEGTDVTVTADLAESLWAVGPSGSFSYTNFITWVKLYPPVSGEPSPSDPNDPNVPDVTPEASSTGDYAILEFNLLTIGVAVGGVYDVFIRIRNNSLTIPTASEIPRIKITQKHTRTLYAGDQIVYIFKTRFFTKVLNPLETKDYVVRLQLGALTDSLLATNNVTIRAEFESQDRYGIAASSTLLQPEDISVFSDYDTVSGNNSKDLTFTATSSLTLTTPTGDGTTTINQIQATFIDLISQALYSKLPGEEYTSEYIETIRQAYRVAERIVWESNKTIYISFSMPYNPDIKRNMTAEVSYSRIGLQIRGLIINYGHTIQNDGICSTQVTIRATEYVFQSYLGEINLNERLDERQAINISSEEIN